MICKTCGKEVGKKHPEWTNWECSQCNSMGDKTCIEYWEGQKEVGGIFIDEENCPFKTNGDSGVFNTQN